MKSIISFLDHEEYPNVCGIIFANGQIQLLKVSAEWKRRPEFRVESDGETSVEILESEGKLWWNSGTILGRNVSDDGVFEAVCGEASWGSDGFVALISNKTRELIWLAAFDCSNPFSSVRFISESVFAESTYGNIWCFPLNDPSRCRIDE